MTNFDAAERRERSFVSAAMSVQKHLQRLLDDHEARDVAAALLFGALTVMAALSPEVADGGNV